MEISLNGQWSLKMVGQDKIYEATVPGDVFSDLQKNDVIANPLIGLNEELVQWVGRSDWEYSRTFEIDEKALKFQFVELNCNMLDTLADVYVNNKLVANTKNINRRYAWNIKDLLKIGENSIKIVFHSPLAYIADKQRKNSLPNSTLGEAGSCHIRKSPYHFGWDWGPHLLTSGISRDCFLNCYDVCKITRLDIKQVHGENCVDVDIKTYLSNERDGLKVKYTLSFEGQEVCSEMGDNTATLRVKNPRIWWCNNMGEQPLYDLYINVYQGDKEVAQKSQKIGLRTITLDKEIDEIGRNFCFYINGKEIFARGANWVPADSFINNVS